MFLFLFIKLLQAINAENEGARASSREGREQTKVSSFLIVFFFGVFVYTCISVILVFRYRFFHDFFRSTYIV